MKVNEGRRDNSTDVYYPNTLSTPIRSLTHAAWATGAAVAIWRTPSEEGKHLIIDLEGAVPIPSSSFSLEEEALGSGFLCSPFDGKKDKLFLRADLYYNEKEDETHLNPSKDSTPLHSVFFERLEKLDKSDKKPQHYIHPGPVGTATNEEAFVQMVERGISDIKQGVFQKIVASRTKPVTLAEDFDCLKNFDRLCAAYPDAFVSLVSTPTLGTWMGASPEVLISVDEAQKFKTVALAGTQSYEPGTSLKNVAWTQKEIEEQALVSRYIINCFKKIRLREFSESGPKTVVAGNLMHLKTTYRVDMEATNFPQLGEVMLELLHPTSAVCGMPKKESLAFLKAHESHDRSLFSGYLGPVNITGRTTIFVNLRCMQLFEKEALLYAGAGITEDSIPRKEWQETEIKCRTLLNIIDTASRT